DTLIKNILFGIHGCLPKDSSSEDMIKAIRTVYSEEIWISRGLISRFITEYSRSVKSHEKLTSRESDITHLIVRGLSNKEIADRLLISEKTVKSHITRVFIKMGVDSRVKLTIKMFPNNH
ncbi:MAG: response regulator transcription factor, partial [Nitrospirae bacterium]|nr:response regulator transcription factor [Nitrospirota bacterium]